MPELAEVSRMVHFIRKELVGRKISKVTALHDDLIFGKAGTSAAEFQKQMLGKSIVGAGQQGKYFWMSMSSPPHPVMHLGMTGWMWIRGADSYYHPENTAGKNDEWPPKFWKFSFETDGDPMKEVALVDTRRLARVRLVDCPADKIRDNTPLKENGPDPVTDKHIVTEEWLKVKLRSKKVPIKALLLDQAQISGLGNWMTDEVLYHAQIHPEQYSNTIKDEQIKALHSAINYVCATSVDLLADSSQFPTDWLFHYRWNKGKKDGPKKLPNGDEIHFLTVGGRTSAVVPSVQVKTGPVAKDIGDDEEAKGDNGEKPKPAPKRGRAKNEPAEPKNEVSKTPAVKKTPGRKPAAKTAAVDDAEAEAEVAAPAPKTVGRKRKSAEKEPAAKLVKAVKKAKAAVVPKAKTKAEPAKTVRRGRSAAKA